MNHLKNQSEKYLEEAELTLLAAKAVFQKAKENNYHLWANVVKNCYDAMEQVVSAAIAWKDQVIPKEHPNKVRSFLNLFQPGEEIKLRIYYWLGRRARAQYVDQLGDKILVPHEQFNETDALKALEDCQIVITEIRKLIK